MTIHKDALYACLCDFCRTYEEWERHRPDPIEQIAEAKRQAHPVRNAVLLWCSFTSAAFVASNCSICMAFVSTTATCSGNCQAMAGL